MRLNWMFCDSFPEISVINSPAYYFYEPVYLRISDRLRTKSLYSLYMIMSDILWQIICGTWCWNKIVKAKKFLKIPNFACVLKTWFFSVWKLRSSGVSCNNWLFGGFWRAQIASSTVRFFSGHIIFYVAATHNTNIRPKGLIYHLWK